MSTVSTLEDSRKKHTGGLNTMTKEELMTYGLFTYGDDLSCINEMKEESVHIYQRNETDNQ